MAVMTPQEQNFVADTMQVEEIMIALVERLNRMKGRYQLNSFGTTITDDKFTTPLPGFTQGPYPHLTQAKLTNALAVYTGYLTLMGDGTNGTKLADLLRLIG